MPETRVHRASSPPVERFRRSRWLGKMLGRVLIGLIVLELALRMVAWGAMPMYPLRSVAGVGMLPAERELTIGTVIGAGRHHYVTDACGARVRDAAARPLRRDEILVVGDSQVMGWKLEFEETFASLWAAERLGGAQRARLLACPASDPEKARVLVDEFSRVHGDMPATVVLAVNIGNDLDELFVGRQTAFRSPPSAIRSFLSERCRLYNFCSFLYERYVRPQTRRRPSGMKPMFYALAKHERRRVADQLVERVLELRERFSAADRVVVLMIPDDIQVDPVLFDRYERFYRDRSEFRHWQQRMPLFSAELDELEGRIAERLIEKAGVRVVHAASALRSAPSLQALFQQDSHHLSAEGNRLVALALSEAIAP